MTRKPEHERVPLQPAGDALDLFPTEGPVASAAAEPPKPALLHVTPAGEFAPIVEMPARAAEEVPRLDGAIEPEPLPPLAIGAAAAAVLLIVMMGVAVLFQRQRLAGPQSAVAAPPVSSTSAYVEKTRPVATVPIAEIKIPVAERVAANAEAPTAGPTTPAKDEPKPTKDEPNTTKERPKTKTPPPVQVTKPASSRSSERWPNPIPAPAPQRGSIASVRPPTTAPVVPPAVALDLSHLKTAPPPDTSGIDRSPVAGSADRANAPASAPAPPPAPSASELIRGVLDQYASALSRLNVADTRAVWPSADASQLRRAFEQLASQQVELGSCDVRAGDRDGSAVCAGRVTIVPRVGRRTSRTESRTWIFDLARRDGRWVISGVKAQ
ncbi:MAG TPA: hypothetical protein VFO19_20405 [Vicinamibacterales bacterium]|nr:hypothetical protein [Vicinamibacterales bacterium]